LRVCEDYHHTNEVFLEYFRMWIREMRLIASDWPGTGSCTLATAMEMWLWTLEHLQKGKDADGAPLYHSKRQGVTFALADALCWLLAVRCLILDVLELETKGPDNPVSGWSRRAAQLLHVFGHVLSARASAKWAESARAGLWLIAIRWTKRLAALVTGRGIGRAR
jgi:hypothetical protein